MATPVKLHKDLVGADLHIPGIHAASHAASGTDPMRYEYVKSTPATVWTITHNLHCYPSVIVEDSAHTNVIGDIAYISDTVLTITFSAPFSGTAHLNA